MCVCVRERERGKEIEREKVCVLCVCMSVCVRACVRVCESECASVDFFLRGVVGRWSEGNESEQTRTTATTNVEGHKNAVTPLETGE